MAQPPVTPIAPRRTAAQVEDDRLQLTYYVRDALMRKHDLTEADATVWAQTCATAMAQLKGNELAEALAAFRQQERRQRDAAIRAELRTGNADQVAERHDLSVRRVYEIAGARPPRR